MHYLGKAKHYVIIIICMSFSQQGYAKSTRLNFRKLSEVVEHEGKKFWIFSLLEIAKYIIGLCSLWDHVSLLLIYFCSRPSNKTCNAVEFYNWLWINSIIWVAIKYIACISSHLNRMCINKWMNENMFKLVECSMTNE